MASACVYPDRRNGYVIRGTSAILKIDTGDSGSTANPAYTGLLQGFELQFERNITKIFDLSSTAYYSVEAPPQGMLSATYIVGPIGVPGFDCACQPYKITIELSTSCTSPGNTGAAVRYILSGAIPIRFGLQSKSDNLVVVSNVAFSFTDLETPT